MKVIKVNGIEYEIIESAPDNCIGCVADHDRVLCSELPECFEKQIIFVKQGGKTMIYEIKNRFSGKVIFSADCEEFKECVEKAINDGANLSGANLSEANLSEADLTYANLSEADLSEANLSRANLSEANLSEADLSEADLTYANLTRANLSRADLTGANLSEANLDMSCFPLKCGSLTIKSSKRLRVQLAFHFLSLIKHGTDVTDQEITIYDYLRDYANEFHRTDVNRLEQWKEAAK